MEHQGKPVYKKKVLYLILSASLLRIFFGSQLELGNDEVYYWTYALHLQASYFDHPALIAFFIRVFTLNLKLNSEILIRLTAIIGSAINTWLMYRILSCIKNEKAGWYAALLYSGCVYTSLISGLFILPDSPQVVFWLLSVFALIKIFILKEKTNKNLLLFGMYAGFATMCKVHGIYLWFAGGLFILFFEREQLKNKYVYIAALITIVIVLPIFIWNYSNDFITYKYQGSRVEINSGISLSSFFKELSGEVLYCNPIVFGIVCLTLFRIVRKRSFVTNNRLFYLLIFLSLPLISLLWCISLFRNTLPHWTGPAYISLLILCAYYADECFKENKFKRWLINANFLILILAILAYTTINYMPLSFGKQNMQQLGAGDVTMDLYGWQSFSKTFSELKSEDIQTHKMQPGAVIISNKWFPAAHLDYYVAHPLQIKLYAFGPLFDIHNFAWLNKQNDTIKKGTDAYYISPSNYSSTPYDIYGKHFSSIEDPVIIHQYRSNIPVRNFYIYRMKNYTY